MPIDRTKIADEPGSVLMVTEAFREANFKSFDESVNGSIFDRVLRVGEVWYCWEVQREGDDSYTVLRHIFTGVTAAFQPDNPLLELLPAMRQACRDKALADLHWHMIDSVLRGIMYPNGQNFTPETMGALPPEEIEWRPMGLSPGPRSGTDPVRYQVQHTSGAVLRFDSDEIDWWRVTHPIKARFDPPGSNAQTAEHIEIIEGQEYYNRLAEAKVPVSQMPIEYVMEDENAEDSVDEN